MNAEKLNVKLRDVGGIWPNHKECLLAKVRIGDRHYMALQTHDHPIMPYTWANPIVATIPKHWQMGHLCSSAEGFCEPNWYFVAHGYSESCEIVVDESVIHEVINAIETIQNKD